MSTMNLDADAFRDAGLEPVERAAAEWVLRQQQGFSPAEAREFKQWLEETPDHRKVFEEMAETSQLLDRVHEPSTAEVLPFTPAAAVPQRKKSLLRIALAAAALVAVGFVGWRQWQPLVPSFAESATTQVGGMRKLDLPDGSVVYLNTNTAVAVNYISGERRVQLVRGEAYFTVAKDPSRPFWVQAGPVAVRAVGTAFNVRIRPDAVNVLVTEGKVRLVDGDHATAPASQPVDAGAMLTTGHQAAVSVGGTSATAANAVVISTVEPRAIKSALAWQEGRLEFIETPLAEVVSEFNRYNRHKIVIADPTLATRRFGGAFASHQIEPLLELLEQSFGVVSEERENETVLRLAR